MKDRWQRAVTESQQSYEAVGHFGLMLRDLQAQVEKQGALLREFALFRDMPDDMRAQWIEKGLYPIFVPQDKPAEEPTNPADSEKMVDSGKSDTIMESA